VSVSRFTDGISRGVSAALLAPVRFYRRFVTPALPARCKYHPTCSAYAVQAVKELGPVKGTIVAGWRLARCNPWSNGGYDPLERRSLFRPESDDDAATHDHAGTPGAPA
jgi:putative membrane protein insertion efficiency factor